MTIYWGFRGSVEGGQGRKNLNSICFSNLLFFSVAVVCVDVIRWGFYKGSAKETGGVGKVKDGGDAKEATGNVNATIYKVDI